MFRKTIPDSSWSRLARVLHATGMHDIGKLRYRIEAVLWRMRTGAPWRDLPTELGPGSTNFNFFNRGSKRGRWKAVFEALRGEMDHEWNLIADKGYDSTAIRDAANQRGISEQIPTRTGKTGTKRPKDHFDPNLYQLRHLVENFFCRIKRHRGIATRYDKLIRNFLSLVYVAAAMEALK